MDRVAIEVVGGDGLVVRVDVGVRGFVVVAAADVSERVLVSVGEDVPIRVVVTAELVSSA